MTNRVLLIKEKYKNKIRFRYSYHYGSGMYYAKENEEGKIYKFGKKQKTVYDEKGIAHVQDFETGEIRLKTKEEIQKVLNRSKLRTIENINQILQANEWLYFVTITFNDEMQKRLNNAEVRKRFNMMFKWLRVNAPDVYYIFVIEFHKKGGIHYHGLMGGATMKQLNLMLPSDLKIELRELDERRFKVRQKPLNYIAKWHMDTYRKRDRKGRTLYCFKNFCKYGKNEVSLVENQQACHAYIKKYITKAFMDNSENALEMGKKRYYVSKNISRPEIEKDYILVKDNLVGKFTNYTDYDLTFNNGVNMKNVSVAYASNERFCSIYDVEIKAEEKTKECVQQNMFKDIPCAYDVDDFALIKNREDKKQSNEIFRVMERVENYKDKIKELKAEYSKFREKVLKRLRIEGSKSYNLLTKWEKRYCNMVFEIESKYRIDIDSYIYKILELEKVLNTELI